MGHEEEGGREEGSGSCDGCGFEGSYGFGGAYGEEEGVGWEWSEGFWHTATTTFFLWATAFGFLIEALCMITILDSALPVGPDDISLSINTFVSTASKKDFALYRRHRG